MEKYIKTLENQELDNFLARNTALNYFQQDRIVSLSQKYAVSKRVVVKVSYYSEVLSEYRKKNWAFGKKWSLECTITDSPFNYWASSILSLTRFDKSQTNSRTLTTTLHYKIKQTSYVGL